MHGGYSSCDKCTEPGEYYDGRVILKKISSSKRTDTSFRLQQDEEHHLGISPLTRLNVGLVSTFPIDYMHACCLGVCRKLLNFWIGGNLKTRLPNRLVKTISQRLVSLKPYIPLEFNRKPRSLDELQRWKATEFRIVLKDVTDLAVYEHFLLFHCAISILISDRHISKYGFEYPNKLLCAFVTHCEKLYGKQFLIYNVHILCHLVDDVKNYGPLDRFSAFPFENYLGVLKKLIKSPTQPLQQIHRRLKEADYFFRINCSQKSLVHLLEHNSGPTSIYTCCRQYRKVKYQNFILCAKFQSSADSYCLIKGKQYVEKRPLYNYPIESSELGICIVDILSEHYFSWSIKDVVSKCLVLPFNNKLL
ncbi:hypothetical protein NQ318_004595 [Aromia moschata]|uniref:DUF4218 domain-containing protein n=1 Tax=Aromia moschata TaxID=1265417 RepID=A0AAV8XQM5_9CUCU|nr:hypothetical protein NQ318_004595 [Aromia moschata]